MRWSNLLWFLCLFAWAAFFTLSVAGYVPLRGYQMVYQVMMLAVTLLMLILV